MKKQQKKGGKKNAYTGYQNHFHVFARTAGRDKSVCLGKYASADLAVGDYIITSKIADEPAAENAYLYNLTGEKQAISVTVKAFANGLSGKLHLSLVYRGDAANSVKFIEAQEAVLTELYPPVEEKTNQAKPEVQLETTETEASDSAEPAAESEVE